jgi:hypothetical protein
MAGIFKQVAHEMDVSLLVEAIDYQGQEHPGLTPPLFLVGTYRIDF